MYQIPINFDASTLENQIVFQIAFGLNFITLFFDKGFIQFSGSFSLRHSGQSFDYNEVYPLDNDLGLLKLLEKKITGVEINENRDILNVQFENESELRIIGNKFYESFLICINGNQIRV